MKWIVYIGMLWWPVAMNAQEHGWQLEYHQQVHASYNNLLSVSRQDTFTEYNTHIVARLQVLPVTDNKLVLFFSQDKNAPNALPLPAEPVWIDFNAQQQEDSIYFSATPSRETEIAVRSLLACIQHFSFSAAMTKTGQEEYFLEGKYPVQYKISPGKSNKTIHLQKTKQPSQEQATGLQRLIFDAYTGDYYFNTATGFADSIKLAEKKHQKIQNRIIAFVSTTFTMRPVAAAGKQIISPPTSPAAYTTCIYQQPDPALRNKLISEKLLQQYTLADLTQQLSAVNRLTYEQQAQLSARFRAWAFLHPAETDTLEALISRYAVYSDAFNLLLDALVNTPLPTAQLLSTRLVMKYKDDQEALRVLLPKLAGTVLPGRELLNGLNGIANTAADAEIASLAGLCFSNLLRSIKQQLPGYYDSAIVQIQQRFDKMEKTDIDVTRFLAACGNAGDKRFIKSVAHYLQSPVHDIQHEALYALRFIPGHAVDSIVAQQLAVHTDSACFSLLYEVLNLRTASPTLMQAVVKYIQEQSGKQEAACLQLISYIGNTIDEVDVPDDTLKSLPGSQVIQQVVEDVLKKKMFYHKMLFEQ